MSKLSLSSLLLVGLIVAVNISAKESEDSAATADAVAVTGENVAGEEPIKMDDMKVKAIAKDDRMICRRYYPTGSHRSRKTCRRVNPTAQERMRRDQEQQELRDLAAKADYFPGVSN